MSQIDSTPPEPPAPTDIDADLLLENWRGEQDAAALYRALAERDRSSERAEVLREIAESEDRHAAVMAKRLEEMGVPLPRYRVSLQTRALILLARIFGAKAVLPVAETMEAGNVGDYASPDQDPAVQALAPEERGHFRTVGRMARGTTPTAIVQHERWHRTGGGGTLRAAIFGVSDGLVSNLALVMGFAGAQADTEIVMLAGVAGLLAGASSMGAAQAPRQSRRLRPLPARPAPCLGEHALGTREGDGASRSRSLSASFRGSRAVSG